MTAAGLTAPLDVVKTRLQSDFYQAQIRASRAAHGGLGLASLNPLRAAGYHLKETMQILVTVRRQEGARALFKGLGANLVGVVPARSINFYTYGNGKRLIAQYLNGGREAAWVHLSAAVFVGIATSTATNPIWMVKTRLQLDKNLAAASGGAARRRYRNSWDCVRQIVRDEGVRGLYKGMSASYLGVAESTLQWVLYEQMKRSLRQRERRIERSGRPMTWWDDTAKWAGMVGAAGGAKLIAAVLTYPHEVSATSHRPGEEMNTDDMQYAGRSNSPPTSANGGRPSKIHRPDPVLPADPERRGLSRALRRHDAASPAHRTQRRHHVRHVRGHPPTLRYSSMKTRSKPREASIVDLLG